MIDKRKSMLQLYAALIDSVVYNSIVFEMNAGGFNPTKIFKVVFQGRFWVDPELISTYK